MSAEDANVKGTVAAVESEAPPSKKARTEESDDVAPGETPSRSPELARLWKVVEDNADDFTGWTQLLQHVDANGTIEEAREAFDAFLHRYPYCYGYWKKYADLERRHGMGEACVAVFERGVVAIPLSVDLWLHYLNYAKTEHKEELERIRELYERAMTQCGCEYRSDKIWDNFVKWEIENKAWPRVLKLYGRILRNMTQGLGHQFEMFRDFVKDHNPRDMLDDEAFLQLRRETLEARNNEEEPRPLTLEEEVDAMREKLVNDHRAIYKATEETAKAIQPFEDNIRRPYFHMKPLEKGQLKNWHAYLDSEMSKNDVKRCEVIFERCLIACALYEQFWTKYLDWLNERRLKAESEVDMATKMEVESRIRDVFSRATRHHLPGKVDIHVRFAAFEEAQGNADASAEILDNIIHKHPQLTSLVLRRINLERRRGNFQAALNLFQDAIEKAATNKSMKADLVIKLSRFLRFHRHDFAEARRVLDEALKEDEQNSKLHLQLLDLVLHAQPLDMEAVVRILDKAMDVFKSDPKQQVLFARRKVDLLEDFGNHVAAVTEARRELITLQATLKSEADKKTHNGTAITTASATNSTASAVQSGYTTQQNNAYQQYGSRYAYPQAANATAATTPQNYYNNYYQQQPPPQQAQQAPPTAAQPQSYQSGYYGSSTYQQ